MKVRNSAVAERVKRFDNDSNTLTVSTTCVQNCARSCSRPIFHCVFVLWCVAAFGPVAAQESPSQESQWWSLRPLACPTLPTVESGSEHFVRNPIDLFVVSKLRQNDLQPSQEADRKTLIRRLCLDLTGLPPTPDELQAFVSDGAPDAYERLVDRLLQSPRYGERWAQHWLDVVHYADSHGQDQDRQRPNAWPYRDYVIRSLNADKPYADFVREQVAGDVLSPFDASAIVATGFLATGPWDESGLMGIREDSLDRQIAHYLDRDDIVSSTLSTFNGLTVGCARCHDHKFDPITQVDYYSLQAVFAGIDKAEREFDADPVVAKKRADLSGMLTSVRNSEPSQPDLVRALEGEIAALPTPSKIYCGTNRFKADGSFKPAAKPREVRVLEQGDILRPGSVASPGAVLAIPVRPSKFTLASLDDEGLRRAALAHWLASDDNPLTWRTIVNRVWHYHFGKGIVDTPNDLGAMGGAPSHPELLDWLALQLRDKGGRLKELHRLIVSSHTYRQSSAHQLDAATKDADNRWLWRMNRGRLDAESFRDSVLLMAGRLDTRMFGPPVMHFLMKPGVHVTPVADYEQYDVDRPDAARRSIYRYMFRTSPDPLLEALDCPDTSQSTPARTASVGALQALALWNNKFTLRLSEHLANQVSQQSGDSASRLNGIASTVLQRTLAPEELQQWRRFDEQHGPANLCRVLFNSSEFLFID
ncbi:MAG: DUF1549 and DUF1553 domain-containing protein [Pirellula sp.]